MLKYFRAIWNSKDLRNKILFTIGILLIYRVLAHITVPGANLDAVRAIAGRNELLQIFSLLTGGSTEFFSIVLMGIGPYINAVIIIQLLGVIFPSIDALSKEGESGRRKLNSYTRWLTFPLAFLQSYGMIILLSSQGSVPIVENITDPFTVLPMMLTISAGTILLVWLGELITEKGIGNGISLIIFASIISQVPQFIGQGLVLAQEDTSRIIPFVVVVLMTIILTVIVVLFTEGQRRVPVTYSGRSPRTKGQQAFLPLRINQAGMIPIIFAVALITFPGVMAQFFQNANSESLRLLALTIADYLQPNGAIYLFLYFMLTIAFTFFYVSITFKPQQVAENIQKRGGYIPGIRPGKQTSDYLAEVSKRLTLFGALFLAFVAIAPILVQNSFSQSTIGTVPLLVSGASIIIMVGVVLELIRQINAELVMHDYGKFY